jgi:hypothetical protein
MGNGLFRIKDGWREGEDSAVLGSQGGIYVEISEHDYREQGYAPLFDDLPWRPQIASAEHTPASRRYRRSDRLSESG